MIGKSKKRNTYIFKCYIHHVHPTLNIIMMLICKNKRRNNIFKRTRYNITNLVGNVSQRSLVSFFGAFHVSPRVIVFHPCEF